MIIMNKNDMTERLLKDGFKIKESIIKSVEQAEKDIEGVFGRIESTREFNQLKVIKSMQDNKVSESHFSGTTGYGYDDRGREVLDSVYASLFKAEDAIVRHQITAGTHALALCMYGNLRPGDELLSITGKPYDTLEEVIGIRGKGGGSLKEFGIVYKQVELLDNGEVDFKAVEKAVGGKTKMVFVQRSCGYCWRPSLKIEDIRRISGFIKSLKPDAVLLVDNCYGEFVEEEEPVEAGADIIAGSLIKNPGGGLAPTGGYIAGKKEYVENAACRLTAPGLGRKVGPTLGRNRLMFQGVFLAPHVVAESLKGAVLCAAVMRHAGIDTQPLPFDKRGDIIQAIKFNNPDALIAFCQAIQKCSAVDSHVEPRPWDMPGYDCRVIMAAGAFIQGSSIELSADAPMKPPYIAYMQGGLVYESVKLGIMISLQRLSDRGIIAL